MPIEANDSVPESCAAWSGGDRGAVTVSVIVPARNCPVYLRRCLEHLAASTCQTFETIVVDDASTDGTANIAEQAGAKVIRLDRQSGPAAARNAGASAACGEYLFFLDADVCVYPESISRIVGTFAADEQVAAVFGSYDTHPAAGNAISQYKNLAHHFFHQAASESASTFWAGCGAVRRSVFLELGGFDETFGRPCVEDIEFGIRLRKHGHRIVLNKGVQVTHLKAWSFWGLVKTDFFDRALPWTDLILRERSLPNDLNLKISQRLSAACVFCLAAVFLFGALRFPALLLPPAVGLIAVSVVDRWSRTRRVPLLVRWLGLSLVPASLAALWVSSGTLSMAAAVLLAMVVGLNAPFYRFFARHRGAEFAAYILPLHGLYYLYSGIAFGLGLLMHTWKRTA